MVEHGRKWRAACIAFGCFEGVGGIMDTQSVDSSSAPAGHARETILEDHAALRRLMANLLDAAAEALVDEKAIGRARELLIELAVTLEEHLTFEEDLLAPLLATADAWGPLRAVRLVDEHGQQRAALTALLEDSRSGVRTTADLVDEIGWFVRGLERDMDAEERTLLTDLALGMDATLTEPIGS
jgi:hypothetical protein